MCFIFQHTCHYGNPTWNFLQRGRIAYNVERCISHGYSICLYVCVSHAGILSGGMKTGSRGLTVM